MILAPNTAGSLHWANSAVVQMAAEAVKMGMTQMSANSFAPGASQGGSKVDEGPPAYNFEGSEMGSSAGKEPA